MKPARVASTVAAFLSALWLAPVAATAEEVLVDSAAAATLPAAAVPATAGDPGLALVSEGALAARVVSPAPAAATVSRDERSRDERAEISGGATTDARKLEGEAADTAPESRRTPRFSLFDVSDLAPPRMLEERSLDAQQSDVSDWSIFDRRFRLEEAPNYSDASRLPLFYVPPVQETKLARFAKKIAHKKFFREVRRRIKGEWRHAFRATPSMSYDEYETTLREINRIGKRPEEFDLFDQDYLSTQLKHDLFQRSRWEGEEDFELLRLGPFMVTDSGSLRLDFGRVLHYLGIEIADVTGARPQVDAGDADADADEPNHVPILASENYRIKTAVRLNVDPFDAYRHDPTWLIDRYGVAVEVDWLSDVLGREIMTTEFEVEFEREGDFAAVVNFVFKSRG